MHGSNPSKPSPYKRCLDLFSHRSAYGCNRIRIYQTALLTGLHPCMLQLIRCKIVIRQSGNALNLLDTPPWNFRLWIVITVLILIKLTACKAFMQIYRNQTSLPVMTVNQIRSETDHRQNRQRNLEKNANFQLSNKALSQYGLKPLK